MHYINLFDMTYDSSNKNIICNESLYRGAIQINENIVALTSNQFLPKGEDKLIFYNIIPRKVYKKKINNYSFNISPNGLTLISNDKNDYIILLCACKKYYHRQKNGILLVIFDKDNIDFETKFYHAKNAYVPLIIYSPTIDKKRSEDMFFQMDVYPTIMSEIGC